MSIRLSPTVLCLAVVCLCSFVAQDVLGVTYYINPVTGQDSAPGTKTSPWKTMAKAKTTAKAGDVVYLRPGSYGSVTFGESGDQYGSSGNYITYANDPESAPYSAKFSYIGFIGARSYYIKIKGFEVYAPAPAKKGIEVAGVDEQKLAMYIIIEDCKAHGNPGSLNASDGPSQGCIHILRGGYVLVDNCEAYNAGGTGGDGIDVFGGGNVTVRSCKVHHILASGINFGGNGPYVAEYNVIYEQRPEWGPAYPNNPHGSGLTMRSDNTTLRGNIIYNYGNTRPIRWYQDETPSDNSLDNGYHDCLVEDNLVFRTDDFTGTMWWSEIVGTGNNFVVRNNTLATGMQIHLAKNADGSGLSLYNNIVPGKFMLNNWGVYYSGGLEALKAQTCEQARRSWDNVKEGRNFFGTLVSNGSGYECKYSSFSATSTSQVGANFAVGSFFASGAAVYPFASGYPYQLASGSPAIGFADKAHATSVDLLNRARDASPDAGCYEYGASGGPTQNLPPVFDTISDKAVQAGSTLTFTVKATDPEGQSVTYGLKGCPSNATFSGNLFSWTPTSDQTGTCNLGFVASDGELSVTQVIQVVVTTAQSTSVTLSINSDNGAVTCNPFLQSYSLNQNVTLTATPDAGYVFSGWSGDLSGTANPATITMVRNTSVIALFRAANTAPVFTPIANQTVIAGSLFTFKVKATDAEGDSVTYSAQSLPAGASFSGDTFSWTPLTAGPYSVNITASDGKAASAITVAITVLASAPDGLVLWMQLNDAPADGVLDSSTYGNHGTSSRLPALVSGYFENAYSFDGVDDFVAVPDSASLDVTQVTLGAWIYVNQYMNDQRIVSKETGTSSPYSVYTLLLSGTQEKRLELRLGINGSRKTVTSSASIPLNTWTHVAATYDGLKAVLYIDGKADKTSSITGAIQTNNNPVYIGASQFYSRSFSGLIDDVVIYNRALLPSEVLVLMEVNNNAPVLAALPDKEVIAGNLLTFQLNGSDVDGDVLSYSASTLPAGAALTGNTFVWTPTAAQIGVHGITFGVSDGELSSSQTMTITVMTKNTSADSRLVLHMACEDNPVDGVLDSSTYSNNGLVNTGAVPAWAYGYLSFDGINDCVMVPDSASLDVKALTLGAWIYVSDYRTDQRIISKEFGTSAPYSVYSLLLSGDGFRKLELRLGINGTRQTLTSDADIPLNTWTHVAATFNGTQAVLYINGVASKTASITGQVQTNDKPVYIGASQFYVRYFAGAIDEVVIYNAALSQSEITALAQN